MIDRLLARWRSRPDPALGAVVLVLWGWKGSRRLSRRLPPYDGERVYRVAGNEFGRPGAVAICGRCRGAKPCGCEGERA